MDWNSTSLLLSSVNALSSFALLDTANTRPPWSVSPYATREYLDRPWSQERWLFWQAEQALLTLVLTLRRGIAAALSSTDEVVVLFDSLCFLLVDCFCLEP